MICVREIKASSCSHFVEVFHVALDVDLQHERREEQREQLNLRQLGEMVVGGIRKLLAADWVLARYMTMSVDVLVMVGEFV